MFVYFIQCGKQGGPIKIGKASDVEKRISELQTGSPFTLSLLAKIPCAGDKDAFRMEKWFHDRFHRKHIRGEWFTGSIKLKTIEANIDHAKSDKDWDEVRSENGASYQSRGKVRPLNGIEKTNQDKADHWAKRSHLKKLEKFRASNHCPTVK